MNKPHPTSSDPTPSGDRGTGVPGALLAAPTLWGAALAVGVKDLRLLVRDKSGFFFTFIFPIGFAVFFGLIFGGAGGGGDSRMKVLTVDDDRSALSARFIERLTKASELNVAPAASVAEAESLVLKRQAVAFVRVPPGYGEASKGVLWGRQAHVEVGVDPSRTAERGMLMGILQQHAFAGLSEGFSDQGLAREQLGKARTLMREDKGVSVADRLLFEGLFASIDRLVDRGVRPGQTQAGTPDGAQAGTPGSTPAKSPAAAGGGFAPVHIDFRDVKPTKVGPTNAFAVTCPQGIIWGLIGAVMGFAASFVAERTGGTLARLRISPMPPAALLLGKAIACFATTFTVSLVIIAVSTSLGLSLSNWPTLLLGVLSVCLGFTGVMMLIAAISPTERAASGVGWAVMMVLAFVGGAAVPTFLMPRWMQDVSMLSPMRWAVQALEGGAWRGYEPFESAMLVPMLVMLGLAVVGGAVGVWSLRRSGA